MRRVAVIAALLWLAAGTSQAPAQAQGDPAALAAAAASRLAEAQAQLLAAERAGDRVKALTETIGAYEDGLAAVRQALRRAALRESELRRALDAESERVAALLGALTGIQSTAGPLVLLHPAGPLGTVRSGMLIAEVTPALQAQVDDLRARLDEVATLRGLQESAADVLAQGLAGVQTARTELSLALSERRDLPRPFAADPAALQALIDGTETLAAFATGLAEIAPGGADTAPIRDFAAARGTLPLPVAGTVLRRFGQADAAGVERPGLVLATRPLALVTAPWSATVRYAGPLLNYGNVIVLEPDAGTMLVLAGAGQVYVSEGTVVAPGDALGTMGGAEPAAGALLAGAAAGTGAEATETLYMELRMDGEPVDPADWFAETRE